MAVLLEYAALGGRQGGGEGLLGGRLVIHGEDLQPGLFGATEYEYTVGAECRPRALVQPARRQAYRPKSTPRLLVAQCMPALARMLPLRRRRSPATTPPSAVKTTMPATTSTPAAGPAPRDAWATPSLAVARSSDGRMCHSPNSADEMSSTRHVLACRASIPQSLSLIHISEPTRPY